MEIENANRRARQAVQQAAVQKQSRQQSKDMPVIKRKSGFGWGSGPFPVRRTKKRKTLLKNKTILSGHAPKFKRGKTVFERDTLKIAEMDVLGHKLFHLSAGGEACAVQTFRFQGAEEIFHRRVAGSVP